MSLSCGVSVGSPKPLTGLADPARVPKSRRLPDPDDHFPVTQCHQGDLADCSNFAPIAEYLRLPALGRLGRGGHRSASSGHPRARLGSTVRPCPRPRRVPLDLATGLRGGVRFSSASFSEPAVDQGREACAGSASGNGTRDRRRGCFGGRPPEAAAGPAAGPPQPGGGVPGSSGCRALARGLLACTAARLPRMAAGAARQSPLRSGPGRSARLCGGARPRSPGTCGDRGRRALLPAGRRRRLRETPVTPITQYQREPDRRPGGGAQIRPSAVPGQHAQAGVVALLDHRG